MNALTIMLKNVIVFVALAIPGYLLIKTKKLKGEQSGALSALLMYIGMPFLIFSSTINNITFNKDLLATIGITLALGIAFTFAMFFISAPLMKAERQEKTKGMIEKAVDDSVSQNSNILVNTLYLKDYWKEAFDELNTYEGNFTTIAGEEIKKE